MLNKTLDRLGWESHPFANRAASYFRNKIALTRTRRQDLEPKVILHLTQGGTGWGKQGLINFATLQTKSAVCLWFASKITTSYQYRKIAAFDYVRIEGTEGSRAGYEAKVITTPITAPSYSVKGAGRDKLGRRRRSKITKLLLETNHSGRLVVAIEIVGFARDAKNYTDAEYQELGEVLADIAEAISEEIGKEWLPRALAGAIRVDDPASRGKKAACRFDWKTWEVGNWNTCMHSNVPNNDHGDCGLLDVDRICRIATEILAQRKGKTTKPAKKAARSPKTASKSTQEAAIEKAIAALSVSWETLWETLEDFDKAFEDTKQLTSQEIK